MISSLGATLASLQPGENATIVDVGGERHLARRLLEMGLTAGTPLRLVRCAPFGDPIEVRLRGYSLTLRRAEAAHVVVRG